MTAQPSHPDLPPPPAGPSTPPVAARVAYWASLAGTLLLDLAIVAGVVALAKWHEIDGKDAMLVLLPLATARVVARAGRTTQTQDSGGGPQLPTGGVSTFLVALGTLTQFAGRFKS